MEFPDNVELEVKITIGDLGVYALRYSAKKWMIFGQDMPYVVTSENRAFQMTATVDHFLRTGERKKFSAKRGKSEGGSNKKETIRLLSRSVNFLLRQLPKAKTDNQITQNKQTNTKG